MINGVCTEAIRCPPHLFQTHSTCALIEGFLLERVTRPYCPKRLSRLDYACVFPTTLSPNLNCPVWTAQTVLDTGPACVELPGGPRWQEGASQPFCPALLRQDGKVCYPTTTVTTTSAPEQNPAERSPPLSNPRTDGQNRKHDLHPNVTRKVFNL